MLKSVLPVCFCILLLNEASMQDIVQGFVGDFALFPCHPETGQVKVHTAHWRYNDNKNVYDILNGQGTTKEQDAEYKGRTETFPAEYSKGNFSLPDQQRDSAANRPRRCRGFRNGPAKRTRIGVHLRAMTDPKRRRIADPPLLRAASAIKTLPPGRESPAVWVRLGNLQKSDEGSYCCFIPEFDHNKCMDLQVTEKPREIQEKQDSDGGVESTAERIVSLLIPLFSATVLLCV